MNNLLCYFDRCAKGYKEFNGIVRPVKKMNLPKPVKFYAQFLKCKCKNKKVVLIKWCEIPKEKI